MRRILPPVLAAAVLLAGPAEAADAPASGSGLGLAIVKAIATRMGATVRLEKSERLGGLRVEVRFRA